MLLGEVVCTEKKHIVTKDVVGLLLGEIVRPILAADKNFFPFFSVSSYVGYVLASDDLGIFCFVWRCEYSSKFSFVTEEKSTFRRKVFGLPKHNMFWEIPK